jgi:hypothetical protein
MRKIAVAAAICVFVSSLVMRPAAAVQTPAPDWVLLPQPDEEIIVRGEGRLTGPLVVGLGYASRPYDWVMAWRVGGDGLSVKASPMGLDVRIAKGSDRFTLEQHLYGGEGTDALLLFAANASFDRLRINTPGDPDPYAGQIVTGRGTRAIGVVDPQQAAPAVALGPAGAGVPTMSKDMPTGIVGAYDFMCVACHGAWTAPAKRRGAFSSAQLYANNLLLFAAAAGTSAFSGPAGTWNWEWKGATVNDPYRVFWNGTSAVAASPIAGAWAPIGKYWSLFGDLVPGGASAVAGSAGLGYPPELCVTQRTAEDASWDAGVPVPTLSC